MTRPIRPAAVLVTTEFIVVGLLPVLARDMGVPLDRAGWLVAAFALSAAGAALGGWTVTRLGSDMIGLPAAAVGAVALAVGLALRRRRPTA